MARFLNKHLIFFYVSLWAVTPGCDLLLEPNSVLKTKCGPTNDLQPVIGYAETPLWSSDFVNKHQSRVGMIRGKNGKGNCSGVLISHDHLLTAGHCITVGILQSTVEFDFLDLDIPALTFAIESVVEAANEELDYGILKIADSPGKIYGFEEFRSHDPYEQDLKSILDIGQDIAIIQHPNAEIKQVGFGTIQTIDETFLTYADLDTFRVSSGAGILNLRGELVGLHTNGGCYEDHSGSNRGLTISSILSVTDFEISEPTIEDRSSSN